MVKKRIYFVNNKLKGNTHEIIDASFIISLAAMFEQVEVRLSKSRCDLIRNICSSYLDLYGENISLDNCNWKGCDISIKSDFFLDLYVALKDVWLMIKGNKNDVFFFSYGNSRFSLYAVNFISKILNRKVVVCAHNELDVLRKENYPFNPNWYYLINRFYRNVKWSKNIHFLVLGDFIIDNLRKTLPSERIKHFFSVDHPYFRTRKEVVSHTNVAKAKKIVVGLVGTVAPNKGLENLEAFVSALDGTNVELWVISRVVSPRDFLTDNKNVKLMNPEGSFLSREKYDEFVSSVDYLFFPYPKDRFCYSVSGSIFESIAKTKPFIAFRNDHFSYLLKKYGTFGILIDDSKQLKSLLENLSDADRYQNMANCCSCISEILIPSKCDMREALDFVM